MGLFLMGLRPKPHPARVGLQGQTPAHPASRGRGPRLRARGGRELRHLTATTFDGRGGQPPMPRIETLAASGSVQPFQTSPSGFICHASWTAFATAEALPARAT